MAYQKQTWVDYPDTSSPLTAERLNHMEDGIEEAWNHGGGGGAEVVNDYSESQEKAYSCNYINNNFESKSKLLWTNPNPTSAFNAQTVTLSSSDYDVLEIFYFDFTDTLNIYSTKTLKGSPCNLMAMFQYQNHGYAGSRLVTYVSDTSYNFQTPLTIIESDAFGRHTASQWCVPLYIVGYKTGLFS